MGQIVYEECNDNGGLLAELEKTISQGQIKLLDGSDIDAFLYLKLLETHNLGNGETECLAYSLTKHFIVSSDDRKARWVIKKEVGSNKITGSLGLIKEAVSENLITEKEAMLSYNKMRSSGAFLPDTPTNFFK